MARVLWRLLPSLLVLLGVLRSHILLCTLRALAWTLLRLVHVAVLVIGSVVVWASLRSWQLSVESEIYETALLKHRFYQKYRRPGATTSSAAAASSGSATTTEATIGNQSSNGNKFTTTSDSNKSNTQYPGIVEIGFQLKVVKRLPVVTHLRTSWSLAPEICDEIAAFVALAVRDYVAFWFQPISPHNDDFPHDVQFLLADLMGALVARMLEIDSSQALTMAAKCLELLRLHLGWFREAYAALADQHPLVFQGDDSDSNLHKRQELMAAYVQSAKFLHPGCVASLSKPSSISSTSASTSSSSANSSTTTKKPHVESAEVLYLRHVATQLLVQLKPELGQCNGSNLFVSIAFNLMRESIVFKALKPMVEYAQPRYANELVVSALADDPSADTEKEKDKDNVSPPPSGSFRGEVASGSSTSTSNNNRPNLKSLRMTKNFLYKASKRSSEQAEVALQAVLEVASTAASQACGTAISSRSSSGNQTSPTADGDFDTDFWSESAAFGMVSPRSPTSLPLSPPPPANERKSSGFASMFSLDDRISFPKTPRIPTPRMPLSSDSTSGSTGGTKASATSITSNPTGDSAGSTHMGDLKNMKANLESSLNSSLFKVKKTFRNLGGHLQDPFPSQLGLGVASTTQAANQAANLMKRPGKLLQKALRRSDTTTETSTPVVAVSPIDFPSTPPPLGAFDCATSPVDPSERRSSSSSTNASDMGTMALRSPTQPLASGDGESPRSFIKEMQMQDRVLLLLEKTTACYVKLYHERVEMRSSARSRELYELLSALEDVFMLGYRKPQESEATAVVVLDPAQLYWNYLAQERLETPFLSDHWRFVETQCPVCGDSESFYSTRGLQWILLALERGSLWEFLTALHLDRRLTELFYDEIAVLRNGKLMEKVLQTLLQLKKLQVALEIPRALGRRSEFLEKEVSQIVRIVEVSWEVERYVPLQGWVKSQDKRSNELPSSEWIWENEWTLELAPSRETARAALATSAAPRRSGSSDSSDVESTLWEYGKTLLDERFHDKEKKLDSVRRRKWIRRRRHLPPVLSVLPSTDVPTSGCYSSPVSRASVVGLAASAASPLAVEQLSSPRRGGSWADDDVALATRKTKTKLSSRLTKRRSFNLDKESKSSTCVVEAMGSPAPRLSGSGGMGSWRRKARNFGGSGDGSPLKRTPQGSTGLVPANRADDVVIANGDNEGGDGDDDDDSQMCFRCLQPLTRASSSTADSCQSCHQRVCRACHSFYAFLVYPPPLESSVKEQVCRSCYERFVARYKLQIDAHVSKYFIREKDNDRERDSVSGGGEFVPATTPPIGISSSNGTGNTSARAVSTSSDADASHRFEVTVQLRKESAFAWSVVKSFADFELLEKQLSEKLKKQEKKHGVAGSNSRRRHWRGVDYAELQSVEPSSLKAFGSATYTKKLHVLESYMQRLLNCDTLSQSSVLQKFLLLGENLHGHGASSAGGESGDSMVWSAGGVSGNGTVATSERASGTGAVSGGSSTSMVMVETGKWRRGKWIAPETNSKETKMRVLQKLEVSLFAVLSEVFEFDGIGLLRRHLFTMTRSFIRAFLSASHFRRLEKQYLTFTDPKQMAAALLQFRQYMFPDPASPPLPLEQNAEPLSAQEMQALRKKSLDAILAGLPSAIVSVCGDSSSANAALKLHEFVQHEIFVKNLLFSISDELLPHVFPDIAAYTPKQTAAAKPATTVHAPKSNVAP